MLSVMLVAFGVRPVLAGFQPHQAFASGPSPKFVATADFNGDGRPDLAVANSNGYGTVSVLLNKTTTGATAPTFADQGAFSTGSNPTGTSPISVAAADLNGDGKPDLVVANHKSGTVSVLLNTTATGATAPAFADQGAFALGSSPNDVAVADFNADGKLDLAVADAGVDVLLNTTMKGAGTPSFADLVTFGAGSNPRSLVAADLNGDGRPDLAIANSGDNTVSMLLNTTAVGAGTPAFADQVTFGTGSGPASVAAADFNGDGRPDLAVANAFSNTVSVLLNAGAASPAFANQVTFGTGSAPLSVAAADLNGDGRPDLALAITSSSMVGVLLNTTAAGAATPSFADQVTFGTGPSPSSVTAADVNGDGKPDLAVANFSSNTVGVLLANPSGTLQFSSPQATAAEGTGSGRVTLSRTGNTDGQVSAIVTVASGTATQGQDFAPTGPQTITWADGDGADKSAVVPIIQDQVDEGNETIQLSLALPANPFGATLGAQTTSALTIADDDPLVLSIANASVAEGDSGAHNTTFTVTRTGNTTRTATVGYITADGSAHASSDYTAKSGSLSFAPNEASKTIDVSILGDTLAEPDETFTLTLSNPTNAVLGISQAVGIILNDDGEAPHAVSIASASTAEGNAGTSTATFTVTRTGSLEQPATVQFATTDGSAKAGSDYTATSGTLSFAPNEASKTIAVPILGDTLPEPDEAFAVALSNPTNVVLGIAQAIGIIQNDDGDALPSLSVANVSLPEGNGGTSAAMFTVTRMGSLSQTITVQYATADGSARAGSDYTATSGTLTFAPNESSKTIAVPVLGDALSEPDESFTVALSGPTNATLGVAQAVGVIQNDDVVVSTACTPRPRVTQAIAASGVALNVHVEPTPLNSQANNSLRQVTFGTFQNATVTLNGQTVSSGQTVSPPPNTFGVDLVVRRATAGQATTVPFTVVDGCGEWSTFVGGGASAGF